MKIVSAVVIVLLFLQNANVFARDGITTPSAFTKEIEVTTRSGIDLNTTTSGGVEVIRHSAIETTPYKASIPVETPAAAPKPIVKKVSAKLVSTKKLVATYNLKITPHRDVVKLTQQYLYSEVLKEVDLLVKYYGSALRKNVIGYSVLREPIICLSFGNLAAKKKILIVAATHGREYITCQLAMKQIEFYMQNYNKTVDGVKISELLKNVRFDYVPAVNPDGVNICQTGIDKVPAGYKKSLLAMNRLSNPSRSISKVTYQNSFRIWKANAEGVDINRNFNAFWTTQSDIANTKSIKGYPGSVPESEPETKTIVNLINTNRYDTLISYHSMGQIIYWYEKQTGSTYTRDKKIATMLSKTTGYSLVNEKASIEKGGLRDWYILKYHKPGFTIEVGKEQCPVPIKEFPVIWGENKFIPIRLARVI